MIIGATVSQTFFSSHVGIGSSGHCLAGDFLISAATSATVAGRKLDSGAPAHLLEMLGCGKVFAGQISKRESLQFAESTPVSSYRYMYLSSSVTTPSETTFLCTDITVI